MKRNLSAALLAAALMLGVLAGCDESAGSGETVSTPAPTQSVKPSTKLDKPPQPEQIIADVNAFSGNGLPEETVVNGCEVIKRQSNPEQKEDIVYCRLTAQDRFHRGEYQLKLLYNFYDEGGWILDEVTPEHQEAWVDGYLDAAGNLIQDDIIWLKGDYKSLRSRGELTFAYKRNRGGHLYDSTGKKVEMEGTAYFLNANFFITLPDGKTIMGAVETEAGWCLMDGDGTRRSGFYPRIGGGSRFSPEETGAEKRWFMADFGHALGFIDQDGREVVTISSPDVLFDEYTYFSNGMCVVSGRRTDLEVSSEQWWKPTGAIDTTGQLVIPCIYEHIDSFGPDGTAKATLNGVAGILDKSGTFTPQPRETAPYVVPDALMGYFYVERLAGDVYRICQEAEAQGAKVFPPFGLARADGTVLLPCTYDYIRTFNDGSGGKLIMAWSGNTYRLYDLEGNCRTPELSYPSEVMYALDSSEIEYYHLDTALFGRFIYQDGAWGLLPQILTAEEVAENEA